jgi:hypothetical protein
VTCEIDGGFGVGCLDLLVVVGCLLELDGYILGSQCKVRSNVARDIAGVGVGKGDDDFGAFWNVRASKPVWLSDGATLSRVQSCSNGKRLISDRVSL